MTRDNGIATSRRARRLVGRARRVQRAGKHAVVLTLRDHQGGPLSVLLVADPGQPSGAYAYFPCNEATDRLPPDEDTSAP